MKTGIWHNFSLGLLSFVLAGCPLAAQGSASLETPGLKAEAGEQELSSGQEASVTGAEQGAVAEVAMQEQKFVVGRIRLVSDDIKIRDFSELLSPYENREINMGELNDLCQRLTKEVRSQGYPAAAVYIPGQSFNQGGELQLRVAPGRYGEIRIDNESGLADARVKGYLAGLKPGTIVESGELEDAVYRLAKLGGVQVAGMLSAGAESGTTDLTVKLRPGKVATEIVYAENYGTIAAGRYRYGLQGNVQLTGAAGTLDYALVISNGKQHNYNLGYSQFVGHSGTRLGVHASRGDYELGGVYRILGARGEAYTYGFSGITPLCSTWGHSLNFNYGYNYRLLEDEQRYFGVNPKKHSHSGYVGVDGLWRQGKGMFSYNLSMLAGFLGLDNDWADALYGAADTEGRYNKGTLDVSYVQAFDRHWDVQLKFSGQMATDNLDGSEEVVLGGINGVRAYPTGIGSGDEGYIGNVELRYHTKVPGLTLSAYLDGGQVFVTHDRDSFSYGKEIAKGWGLGLTYTKPGNYFLRLDYARRIGELRYYSDKDARDRNRLWFMAGKVF